MGHELIGEKNVGHAILCDKTHPAAYAKRLGVVYLLEKLSVRFYNIFPV